MPAKDAWPEADRQWISDYVNESWRQEVPPDLVIKREDELLRALREDGRPARDLFGPPGELARADAEDLDLSEGRGRDTDDNPREARGWVSGIGFGLTALGIVAGGYAIFGGRGPVDLTRGNVVIGLTILVFTSVGFVLYGLWDAGRFRAAVVALAVGVLAVLGGVALGFAKGSDTIVVSGLPRWALAAAMVAPGVLLLLLARLLPQSALRRSAADAEDPAERRRAWMRHFDGTLKTRLVPPSARAHAMRDMRGEMDSLEPTADPYRELGDPRALARRVSRGDDTSTLLRFFGGLALGLLIPVGYLLRFPLRTPVDWWSIVLLVLALLVTFWVLRTAWRERPWKDVE